MTAFCGNIVFALLISGPAFALQMPHINLPEGYSTSFHSAHNTLHLRAPTSPPKLPAKGAVSTGVYRNMFVEYGLSKESVQARIHQVGVLGCIDACASGRLVCQHRGSGPDFIEDIYQGKSDTKSCPPSLLEPFVVTNMLHARFFSSSFTATRTLSPCTTRARMTAGRTSRTSATATCAARACREYNPGWEFSRSDSSALMPHNGSANHTCLAPRPECVWPTCHAGTE